MPEDPRTKQAQEVFIALAILLLAHLSLPAFIRFDQGTYFNTVVFILPAASIVAATILKLLRNWHFGQIFLFLPASAVMTFLHVLIVGSAIASV